MSPRSDEPQPRPQLRNRATASSAHPSADQRQERSVFFACKQRLWDTGPGYAGVQRVTWDLNRDKPRPREMGGPTSPQELRRVAPGDYVVHMTVGKVKAEQKFTVSDWPMDPQGRLR